MRKVITALVAGLSAIAAAQSSVQLPGADDSLKFAIIGDNGTGSRQQYEVGEQMATVRGRAPFELVLMLGDNLYGRQQPEDFVTKFELPYKKLLDNGVTFFAALGNHDAPREALAYRPFNMNGQRYYTFTRKGTRFIVIDTNLLDRPQLNWIDDTLRSANEPWIVATFHHPIYSSAGRHGSNVELRVELEPLLIRYGVDVVFSGHDHAYERMKPQSGITYFLEGASGQLRKGDIQPSAMTAAYADQDQSFMVAEIVGDDMTFQTITRTGHVIDSGIVHRR